MFKDILNQLLSHQDLPHDTMLDVMQQVMAGTMTPAQIAALLIALRMKGESVTEIAAAASVMRSLSTKVEVADKNHLVDTCGTGGDGIQTFNVSTVSAFVAAAAGAKVAKHGGRSVSSSCGSADVLEALGVNLSKTPQQVADSIVQVGIGFMFAPNHHNAMKHAAPVRRELGVRTLFNLLGPLTNPASATRQLMGVFTRDLTGQMAQVLQALGAVHVMVVHGADGMDEITCSGETWVAELKDNHIVEYSLHPELFGLNRHALEQIRVDNAAQSAQMILDVLAGKPGAARDIVLMNAGAAIYVAGIADTLVAGVQRAAQAIDSGQARAKLDALIQLN